MLAALVLLAGVAFTATGVAAAVSNPDVAAVDGVFNGIINAGDTHGIIIINSYTDNIAKIDLSFNGLNPSLRYRFVGSSVPCSQPNTDRTTIFGIVIVNSRSPFREVRNTSIHDQLPGLLSLRLLDTSRGSQVACTHAVPLTAAR